jgi:hypothetical protein
MENALSSNLAFAALFSFRSRLKSNTVWLAQGDPPNEKEILSRFYVDRIARRDSDHHHSRRNRRSSLK